MIFTRSSNIYETFAPLYKVLKLFGLIPFKFNLKNGAIAMGLFDFLYIFVMWIFWIFLLFWNYMFGYLSDVGGISELNIETEKFLLTGFHWILMFQLFGGFFIHLISFRKRKHFEKFFKILFDVDKMVKDLK